VALFLREHADQLLTERIDTAASLSHAAREALEAIDRRGAPFFKEIVSATGRLPAEVEEALWELVAAGLVTADGFDALRSLIESKRRLGRSGRNARPRAASGRWTRLRAEPSPGQVESFARGLLSRWGIVSRDVIAHETLAPAWREILVVLRRLEARGEIRGGRFVAAILGEQFALAEAIETLRAVRRSSSAEDPVCIADTDPLRIIVPVLEDSQKTGRLSRDADRERASERIVQNQASAL
jgi:ATP-dependent Lhr-like helicase